MPAPLENPKPHRARAALARWARPLAAWLLLAWLQGEVLLGQVLAQDAGVPMVAPPSKKSFVYQYFLVGLCLALGVFILSQPSKRTEQVEPKTEELV